MTEVPLTVDGSEVSLPDTGGSLLDALREQLGARAVKDGCSPQGQCGCCTVLVDGAPRLACVTALRRVAGRSVTTVDGLADRDAWAEAFCAAGASQCGFCTPGIIVRLAGRSDRPQGDAEVRQLLKAHVCRCTGWNTIVDAAARRRAGTPVEAGRDLDAASARASLETGGPQRVSPEVALGHGGFADDTAPADALVAVLDDAGCWVVAESLAEARRAAGAIQGRRTTAEAGPPLDVPAGEWSAVLRTSWVEPAPLEIDASWCEPGGDPASPLANGGAFGAKLASIAPAAARRLADEHGRAVRVVLRREDSVRLGPKRPPVAGGIDAHGHGVLRVVRTPGIVAAIARVAPDLRVEEVEVAGPPTSSSLRAAGWGEAAVLMSGGHGDDWSVRQPGGGLARASVDGAGAITVAVDAGDPLDEVVLRSFVIGSAHQALSWVTSESIAVDPDGTVHDLTMRSFGILRAVDMPRVDVEIVASSGPPVAVGDAAFVAVAAAVWRARGRPADWPTGRLTT